MTEVVLGMVIGTICGSLATAAYIGIFLNEEQGSGWIDKAIARAFAAADAPRLEEHPPR